MLTRPEALELLAHAGRAPAEHHHALESEAHEVGLSK